LIFWVTPGRRDRRAVPITPAAKRFFARAEKLTRSENWLTRKNPWREFRKNTGAKICMACRAKMTRLVGRSNRQSGHRSKKKMARAMPGH
jgi:hypothetical protein